MIIIELDPENIKRVLREIKQSILKNVFDHEQLQYVIEPGDLELLREKEINYTIIRIG